jgi:hypothetical protein
LIKEEGTLIIYVFCDALNNTGLFIKPFGCIQFWAVFFMIYYLWPNPSEMMTVRLAASRSSPYHRICGQHCQPNNKYTGSLHS